jgi:hypothetical protein
MDITRRLAVGREIVMVGVAVMTTLVVGACDGTTGRLTTDEAQRAVDRWMGTDGTVKVTGVQEVAQENVARADLAFTNFKWRSKDSFTGTSVMKEYEGGGVATFKHYNDGRWVLARIDIPKDLGTWWDNLNIEVK